MGSIAHARISSHTPLERVVLEIKCAHGVPWLACSLKALDAVHSLPFGACRFCTRLHPHKTGKISVTRNGEKSMSSSGLSLPPLTRSLELVTFVLDCRLELYEPQASCWQYLGTDLSFGGNFWRYHPRVAGLGWHEYACEAAGDVLRPQSQST